MKKNQKTLTVMLIITMIFTLVMPIIAEEGSITHKDSHWAKNDIERWIAQGIIEGYPGGSYEPDAHLSHAEFVVHMNKLFGIADFVSDAGDSWHAMQMLTARLIGFLDGFPDFESKADIAITREDAAALLVQAFFLQESEGEPATELLFSDADHISEHAQKAISILTQYGVFIGYPDGSFKPQGYVTQAEMAAMLTRLVAGLNPHESDKRVIYGHVIVNTTDIVLKDIEIKGNLYLTAGIGDGDATLNNVIVRGTTYINGGGPNSVVMTDSSMEDIEIDVISEAATYVEAVFRFAESGNEDARRLIEILNNKEVAQVEEILEQFLPKDTAQPSDVSEQANAAEKQSIRAQLRNRSQKAATVRTHLDSSSAGAMTVNSNADVEITGESTIEEIEVNSASNVSVEDDSVVTHLNVTESGEGSNLSGDGRVDNLNVEATQLEVNGHSIGQGNYTNEDGAPIGTFRDQNGSLIEVAPVIEMTPMPTHPDPSEEDDSDQIFPASGLLYDFEENIEGWTISNNEAKADQTVINSVYASHGESSLSVDFTFGHGSFEVIKQGRLDLTEAKSISVDVKFRQGSAPVYLFLRAGDEMALFIDEYSQEVGSWEFYTVTLSLEGELKGTYVDSEGHQQEIMIDPLDIREIGVKIYAGEGILDEKGIVYIDHVYVD